MRVYKSGAIWKNRKRGTVEAARVAALEKKEELLSEQWEPMGQQKQRRSRFATETQTSTYFA